MCQFPYLTFSIINTLPVLMHSRLFWRSDFSGSRKWTRITETLIIIFRGRIHLIHTWKMKSQCPCPNYKLDKLIQVTNLVGNKANPLISPNVLILWAEFASVSLSVNCLPQSSHGGIRALFTLLWWPQDFGFIWLFNNVPLRDCLRLYILFLEHCISWELKKP